MSDVNREDLRAGWLLLTFMGFGNAQVRACIPRYPTTTNRLRYFRVETSTARLRRIVNIRWQTCLGGKSGETLRFH